MTQAQEQAGLFVRIRSVKERAATSEEEVSYA